MIRVGRSFSSKMRWGRFGAPVWALALAVASMAAVAGQALGPVLAGGAGGTVGVVATQSIFFTSATAEPGHDGDIDQAAANIDTSGLIVIGAFRMHRGDSPSTMDIGMENRGDGTRSARLTVVRPAGSAVDLSKDSTCGLAQSALSVANGVQTDTYLLTVTDTCTLTAKVAVGSAEPLGSYSISLSLQEIP